jgi:hypothetical protein
VALPAYDAEKHHVGLEGLGLIVAGAYSKAFKRDLSDEKAGVHYGSESFFNQPGLSSWSMDDFTGGAWQQVWGKDPKMFASSQSMLPASFDRSLRTVPPLTLRAASGVGGGIYSAKPLAFFAHQGWVVSVFPDRIYRYNIATGGAAEVIFTEPSTPFPITHAVYDRRLGYIIATYDGGANPGVCAINPLTTGDYIVATEDPAVNTGDFTGLDVDGDRLVLASADVIWTVQLQDGVNIFGGDFTRAGRLPARFVDSCWMGQQLYILCGGSDRLTSVVAFDGVQVLPVTELPYNFFPRCIVPYAGRLYVGGSGLDISGVEQYAELYEITGSSLRLVKTFADEQHSTRYVNPRRIDGMAVHEGLLFFGEYEQGLIAYDITTDALYGAHRFDPGQEHTTCTALSILSARSHLWVYANRPALPFNNGIWGSVSAGDAAPLDSATGEMVTSEFGPELDRKKKWSKLRVLTRGDSNEPQVYQTLNGGATWLACPLLTTEISGIGSLRTYSLEDRISNSTKFAIRLPRNASPTISFAELVSFSAAFNLVDTDDIHEDGGEKLAWQFAVAGVETVELEDGSIDTQRLGELRAQLWEWAQNRDPITFRDTDGNDYTVIIDSIRENQPVILPSVGFKSSVDVDDVDDGREAFYALTLVEE